MAKLSSVVENLPTTQSVCQLELWQPTQGSMPEAIPVSIDLDFDVEKVALPTTTFSISANRATVHLEVVDADVVRGSRFGEHIHDPDLVAEVTQCVRTAIEAEYQASGDIDISVTRSLYGKLTALVSWRKRKSTAVSR